MTIKHRDGKYGIFGIFHKKMWQRNPNQTNFMFSFLMHFRLGTPQRLILPWPPRPSGTILIITQQAFNH